jgi:hypothetical protein
VATTRPREHYIILPAASSGKQQFWRCVVTQQKQIVVSLFSIIFLHSPLFICIFAAK